MGKCVGQAKSRVAQDIGINARVLDGLRDPGCQFLSHLDHVGPGPERLQFFKFGGAGRIALLVRQHKVPRDVVVICFCQGFRPLGPRTEGGSGAERRSARPIDST